MTRETRQQANQTEQTSHTNQQSASSPATGNVGPTTPAQTSGQGDRERSLQTGRESGRSAGTGVARRQGQSLARGDVSSPFALMQRMAQDMDRLFEQFGFGRTGLGSWLGSDLWNSPWSGSSALDQSDPGALWSPQVEMFQRGDKLVVRADLPGMRKDDVHLEVENDTLTISGERKAEHEENRGGFYRSERSYGQFFRAIPLPEGVSADQVEASFRDGVLEVTLPAPRQEERPAKRIPIR
ncbi:MAG: Hsp20/alpha crystallin family protein [Gemmatimonadaceae bacterium]